MFGDPVLVLRWFWSFLLPVLEYCSPLWMSAAASHLGLIDRVVPKAVRLNDVLVVCDEARTSYRCTLHVLQDSS